MHNGEFPSIEYDFFMRRLIVFISRWPQYTGEDETHALLHDLAGLITSNKVC
jgi:hypothetical protein